MKVALSILPKSVLVTILTDDGSETVDPDVMFELEPNTQLGSIPYERLRALGEGVHELFDQHNFRIIMRKANEGPLTCGDWLGLACLPIIGAMAGYFGFAHWEEVGGSMRTHWIVALIYAVGGKWSVAGVFGLAALGCLGAALKTLIIGRTRTQKKRRQIREALEEMAEEESKITFSTWPARRQLFVKHEAGDYTLFLPEQFLTDAELKRAVRQLGQLHLAEPDPYADTVPSGFMESLGHDVDRATDRILDLFSQVYHLHPSIEISAEERFSFVDDEEAYGEDETPYELQGAP